MPPAADARAGARLGNEHGVAGSDVGTTIMHGRVYMLRSGTCPGRVLQSRRGPAALHASAVIFAHSTRPSLTARIAGTRSGIELFRQAARTVAGSFIGGRACARPLRERCFARRRPFGSKVSSTRTHTRRARRAEPLANGQHEGRRCVRRCGTVARGPRGRSSRAEHGHAIVLCEQDLCGQPADRACDGHGDKLAELFDHFVSRHQEHGSPLVRWTECIPADLTPLHRQTRPNLRRPSREGLRRPRIRWASPVRMRSEPRRRHLVSRSLRRFRPPARARRSR